MKSSNYITKVISHITNKKQKSLVEYELTDHIIEKHNFYEDIGYNDDASFEKADKIMGDADIVGEQFEALNKAKNIKKIIATIISFLLFAAAAIYIAKTADNFCSFYDYVACNIIFILNLISIIYGFRKLRVNNIIFGCIACLGILGTGGKYIENSIYYLFTGQNVFLSFYGIYNDSHASHQIPFFSEDGNIVFITLTAIFILVLITGATLIVRLGKLKNTRTDLKINLTVRILLIILTIGLTALFGYYSYEVPSYRDEVIAQTRADLEKYDKIFIENSDTFRNGSYNEIAKILRDELDADISEQEIEKLGTDENNIKYKSGWDYDNTSHYVYYFIFIDAESGFDFETRANAIDLDGKPLRYCSDDEISAIEPLILTNQTRPQDLPYPFEIHFSRGNAMNNYMTAVYNSYDYDEYYESEYAGYENYINFKGDMDDMHLASSGMYQNEDTLSASTENFDAGVVIGGADGPTAVFVTSKTPWWAIGAGAIAIISAITAIAAVILKKKKK